MPLRRINAPGITAAVSVIAVLALGGCSLTEEGTSVASPVASPIVLMQVNDSKVSVDESGSQITLTVASAPFDVSFSVAPVVDVVRIERADAPDIVLDLRSQPPD